MRWDANGLEINVNSGMIEENAKREMPNCQVKNDDI